MTSLPRRTFLSTLSISALGLPVCRRAMADWISPRPNIILCMSDDQGWGDVGYKGHPHLKTPHLDRMAAEGFRFDRFYSGAPVCSPTRGSCLTGRNAYRYGVYTANEGHLPSAELTLAEMLKEVGYTTGHFGKWHLGTLTAERKDSNRGRPGDDSHYSPPWVHGFDVCFSTEAKVPTWDPTIDPENPGKAFGTAYWTGPETAATENLEGDDSRVIMDRALPFIQKAAKEEKPFFAVIWFHSPHNPVVAGKDYREMYSDQSEDRQHFYGCITALDEQMGRLRNELADLGIAENTMLWFCSDNGPAGAGGGLSDQPGGRQQGTTGGLRGRKGTLYEGGVRVPGLLVWPGMFPDPKKIDAPCSTCDYVPTIREALGLSNPKTLALDGESILPILSGKQWERERPIPFEFKGQLALTGNRHKIYSGDGGPFELYDLLEDPGETEDLAAKRPKVLMEMTGQLRAWRETCAKDRQALGIEDDRAGS